MARNHLFLIIADRSGLARPPRGLLSLLTRSLMNNTQIRDPRAFLRMTAVPVLDGSLNRRAAPW